MLMRLQLFKTFCRCQILVFAMLLLTNNRRIHFEFVNFTAESSIPELQ